MWNRCIDVWENIRLISSEWEALDLDREDCQHPLGSLPLCPLLCSLWPLYSKSLWKYFFLLPLTSARCSRLHLHSPLSLTSWKQTNGCQVRNSMTSPDRCCVQPMAFMTTAWKGKTSFMPSLSLEQRIVGLQPWNSMFTLGQSQTALQETKEEK